MQDVSRYHPVLVVLHWLLAVLILGALGIGFFALAATPDSDPGKIGVLRLHMVAGIAILLLTFARLFVRWGSVKPIAATTGSAILDRLGIFTHYALYLVVVLMVATGLATALLAGLPGIVFGNAGATLPKNLDSYPTLDAHSTLALVLVALIALHIVAALWHQFVRKDGLLRRMSLGRAQG